MGFIDWLKNAAKRVWDGLKTGYQWGKKVAAANPGLANGVLDVGQEYLDKGVSRAGGYLGDKLDPTTAKFASDIIQKGRKRLGDQLEKDFRQPGPSVNVKDPMSIARNWGGALSL